MNILMQLLGRLHPVIVHLPIGFIILALVLSWYDRKEKVFTNGIAFSFLWGGISAALACITGYFLYQTEGYAFDTIKMHLWLGIITAIFCFFAYARLQETPRFLFLKRISTGIFFLILFGLISFTGHLGGSITHGEEYLVEPLPNSIKSIIGITVYEEKEITLNEENWQDVLLYEDIIHPILNNKCLSCHNSKKNKGKLILQSSEAILRGGGNGEIIIANRPDKSALYTKLILPKEHDEHMPPEGKTQLTKEEIKLIHEWIKLGNSFEKSIEQLGLKKELLAPFFPRKIDNNYPDVYVQEAAQQFIDSIENHGIHVDKINKESHFLTVSCINQANFEDKDFELLLPIAANISILDLGGTLVTDAIFKELNKLPHLTILKLDNTIITGKDISLLMNLEYLKSINLASSNFKASYLEDVLRFKNLKKVYLHSTTIKPNDLKDLKAGEIAIDIGNYDLPLIKSDSIIY